MAEYLEKDTDLFDFSESGAGEAPLGKGVLHEVECEGAKYGITVSVFSKNEEEKALASLKELSRLFDTVGGVVCGVVTQMREKPDGRTCIGKGKLSELSELVQTTGAELVIFDRELTPSQISNIEAELEGAVSVIDRSMLILDIFALHAASAEGSLQVELAQLKYTAPRLMGKGRDMSRLGGGVGTRGPGETKLEIDRRRLKARIHSLESELEKLEAVRVTKRRGRDKSSALKCAIVGYTNAGKSTLLNRLTDAGILAEDKLFATLDPTTRQYELPMGTKMLLTDTVGFIRNLPHHLIEAFKSTLDEAVFADMLMIVCDASDPEVSSHLEVTRETLESLGAVSKPTLYVFNKCDVAKEEELLSLKSLLCGADERCVFVSAETGEGISEMIGALCDMACDGKKRVMFKIPFGDGAVVSLIYSLCDEVEIEYGNEFIEGSALCDSVSAGKIRKYIVNYGFLFPNPDDFDDFEDFDGFGE